MLKLKTTYLPTTYLGPIRYYTKFLLYTDVHVELHETFLKQSYRNRCTIYSANGAMDLVVPVNKVNGNKTKTKDILIDYDTEWQKNHWKTIESAYRSSPYFEFYEDDFKPFYEKKIKYLIDLNLELESVIFDHIKITKTHKLTTRYIDSQDIKGTDYRESISPKKRLAKPDESFMPYTYVQVFSDKFGFIPNLSIIDLLFNAGPETKKILKKSIVEGVPD